MITPQLDCCTRHSNSAATLFKLANEEVGGGELSGAVDDVEEQRSDPEHGVDAPSVPREGGTFAGAQSYLVSTVLLGYCDCLGMS